MASKRKKIWLSVLGLPLAAFVAWVIYADHGPLKTCTKADGPKYVNEVRTILFETIKPRVGYSTLQHIPSPQEFLSWKPEDLIFSGFEEMESQEAFTAVFYYEGKPNLKYEVTYSRYCVPNIFYVDPP